jgi:hypothetical protein
MIFCSLYYVFQVATKKKNSFEFLIKNIQSLVHSYISKSLISKKICTLWDRLLYHDRYLYPILQISLNKKK